MSNDKIQVTAGCQEVDEAKKYESEMAHIFEELHKDLNFANALEAIFDGSNNLNEIQSKIILLIEQYISETKGKNKNAALVVDTHKIAQDIDKISSNFMKTLGQEADDPEISSVAKKDELQFITGQAKKDLMRTLKNLAVYELYKVMNPRRIAGETKKDNYINNTMVRGHKIASLYEGGSKAEVQSYDKQELARIEKQSNSFRKGGNNIGI